MVTSTTPFSGRKSPLWRGSLLPPPEKPPPWIQNITGRLLLLSALAGAYTFKNKQSSLGPSSWKIISSKTLFCAQCGAYLVASRSPFHFAAGCGAFHRNSPTGGAAYGKPSQARTLPSLIVLP